MDNDENELFGINQVDSSSFSQWSLKIAPLLTLPLKNSDDKIDLVQNSKGVGELGSRVWNGALVLARYAESLGRSFWTGKKVLEIGAGTGISALMVAKLGGHITITDKQALLKLIQYNADRNLTPEQLKNVHVETLFWGQPSKYAQEHFDYIIGADLTYDFEDLPPLLSSMKEATEVNRNAQIFLAYGKERAAMPEFFEQANKVGFEISHVDENLLDSSDVTYHTNEIAICILKRCN